MNALEKKQLNLLVHLAKVDGKFEKSEKELLKLFMAQKRLDQNYSLEAHQPVDFSDLTGANEKIELLYWALRMIQADKIIHDKEILFCKKIASKLNFKTECIDHYAHKPLPSFEIFEEEIEEYQLT